MRSFFILTFFFLWFSNHSLWATHQRAGEITYRHISGLTYEFTLVDYTYTPSYADRPSLDIDWGDGTQSTVYRNSKVNFPNNVSLNTYKATHTFLGQGTYTISMEDPNRNQGVINIPNSVNVPFYVQTTFTINPFITPNNSAVLLNPPLDMGCTFHPFYHNAAAYDMDGDSLAYELVHCRGIEGYPIAGYFYPQASNSFSIDAITGTLTWDSPIYQGEYNVAFLIKEYRNGVLISSITRDMQITIFSCNNNPPQLQPLNDTCVVAGSQLQKMVKATDANNDAIRLYAYGGPLEEPINPATFPQGHAGVGAVQGIFSWNTHCTHVRKEPYLMTFKAQQQLDTMVIVDIETMFITVVAPAPKNLSAEPQGVNIRLNWEKSKCAQAIGYDIYRHNGYLGYHPDHCVTGVPAWTGYVKVGTTSSHSDTTFVDNNGGYGLVHGPSYCYMVVAVFADGAESYPSLETCASLQRDVPIISHVSIQTTHTQSGEVKVQWFKPDTALLNNHSGPFKYLIFHNQTDVNQSFVLVDSLSSIFDTTFIHQGVNTQEKTQNYRIDFYNDGPSNRYLIGSTHFASSVFLKTEGHDKRIELSWKSNTPWDNYLYEIHRMNSGGTFFFLTTTTQTSFTDSNLINGATYCYLVKSIGQYSAPNIMWPLFNWSQEVCAKPIDDEIPCAPILKAQTNCLISENYLQWSNPNATCHIPDVVGYQVYYSSDYNSDFQLIYTAQTPNDTTYIHSNLSSVVGCYYVQSVDSVNNLSLPSNKVCIELDSCRLYSLPNVFTPNGDGYNDQFIPFPYDFVERVDMKIFNRWGMLVFQTEDPDINWDGVDITSKQPSSDGVYFYVCEVYEHRLQGLTQRTLKGTVSLYR